MTKSKEQKAAEEQEQQAIDAQNTQDNAGVPPNANDNIVQDTNVSQAEAHIQTVPNVSPEQAQKDVQAQATIQQNIDGDKKAHEDNENLKLLKRIVGKASPIVEDVKETEEQTDANGNKVQVPVFKKVTKGYTYYAVDGQPFEEWVQETFGGTISIDTENNKIIYNDQQ